MSLDGSEASKDGGATAQRVLKKGPWTASEDAMLLEYVNQHGDGNWNAVHRKTGLMRCGKSCRLRWANHLRPNLKKGSLTGDEERLIIQLHARFGNKWARIAAQLPGRTDNEIKNYWNTRVKRRQRIGLPIYPQEVQQRHIVSNPKQPTISPSFLTSHLSKDSCSPSNFPLFRAMSMSSAPSYLPNASQQFMLYRGNNGSVALSFSPSFSSSTLAFNPTSSAAHFLNPTPTSLPYSCNNFGINPTANNNFGRFSSMGIELPLIQSPLLAPATPTSSSSSGSGYVGPTSSEANNYEIATDFSQRNSGFSRGNSDLLEDLLGESQVLAKANGKLNGGKQANEVHVDSTSSAGQGDASLDKALEHSSFPYSATEKIEMVGMNSMDEDLLSLLDNFPMSFPVTEWEDKSNATSSGGTENGREASPSPIPATGAQLNHDWRIDGCYWNKMPTIF